MHTHKKYLIRICFALIITTLVASVSFASNVGVMLDGVKKGTAATRTVSRRTEIAIEEVMPALGYSATEEPSGLFALCNGKKIEFWNQSAVVRADGKVVSLAYPIEYADGHWWAEQKNICTLFNNFNAQAGIQGTLVFANGEKSAAVTGKQKILRQSTKKTEKSSAQLKGTTEQQLQTEINDLLARENNRPETKEYSNTNVVKKEFTKRKPIVVIDAGHGAHDPGASGHNTREKDINLKAALALGNMLKRYGVDVLYTRSTDVFLKLQERTAFANKHNADVFVSMHCNSLPKPTETAQGIEIYLMASPRDKDSLRLAIEENKEVSGNANSVADLQKADSKTRLLLKILGDMQQTGKISESTQLIESLNKAIKANGLHLRKVSQAPFFVLRGAGMPAVLIEMGYLSSATDTARLNSASYREQLALSVAQGVVEYIKTHIKL